MKPCKCDKLTYKGLDKRGRPIYNHQPLEFHNPELWVEIYNPTNYKGLIKDYCVICLKATNGDWEHYRHYGNFCAPCRAKTKATSRADLMIN